MEIFEQYFYDINQWERQHGNSHPYSDMINILQEKIDLFQSFTTNAEVENSGWMQLYNRKKYSDPGGEGRDLYRIGRILITYKSKGLSTGIKAQYVTREQLTLYQTSKLLKRLGDTARYESPTYSRFNRDGKDWIQIHPHPVKSYEVTPGVPEIRIHPDTITIFYTKKPVTPNWGYAVVNQKALYNSTSSTDFELHESEESELVYRVLALAGVAIQKPNLTQVAVGLEGAKVQQQKQ